MRTPGTAEQKERQRPRALALVQNGLSSAAIGRQLGVDPRTVRRWKSAYRRNGKSGLRIRKAPGRRPRLTAQQRRGVVRRLLQGAIAHGFSTELWTCPRIAQMIEREFRVRYHVDYIPRLMRGLGFTVQKPERQARERNERAIQEWVRRDWVRFKKRQHDTTRRSFSSTKRASS